MRQAARRWASGPRGRGDELGKPLHWLAARVRNEVRHSHHRPCLERPSKRRMNWDKKLVDRALARLVLRDTYPAFDNVGAKHFDHVAAALAGVEQQRERKPLARPKRPAAFELCDLRIRPGVIGAEPIWFETRAGIVCTYVGLDCIGHHLRKD